MLSIEMSDNGLEARIRGLSRALDDMRPVWPEVHDVVVKVIKENLDTGGGRSGGWAPLNPGYAAWKERHYPGRFMMHLTYRLYPSLTQVGHGEHVANYGRDFAEIGTSVIYAKAHQYGRPEINLWKRVLIPRLNKNDMANIADVILAWIFKTLRMGRRR